MHVKALMGYTVRSVRRRGGAVRATHPTGKLDIAPLIGDPASIPIVVHVPYPHWAAPLELLTANDPLHDAPRIWLEAHKGGLSSAHRWSPLRFGRVLQALGATRVMTRARGTHAST